MDESERLLSVNGRRPGRRESSEGVVSSASGRQRRGAGGTGATTQEQWPAAGRRLSKRCVMALIVGFAVLAVVAVLVPLVAMTVHSRQTPEAFAAAVHLQDVRRHLQALALATGQDRSPGSLGYAAAAQYVMAQLQGTQSISVTTSNFSCPSWRLLAEPQLALEVDPASSLSTKPALLDLALFDDYLVLPYSGSGSPVNLSVLALMDAAVACQPSAYANLQGQAVLVPAGTSCGIYNVTLMAQAAGAEAVLEASLSPDQELPFDRVRSDNWSDDDEMVHIPVLGVSYLVSQLLSTTRLRLTLSVRANTTVVDTFNIVAETSTGGHDGAVVVVGAHLDTTQDSQGYNDNGSGAATLLALALTLTNGQFQPRVRVRFVWWSGQTEGGIGSRQYIRELQQNNPADLLRIQGYIDLDMLGSPNYVYAVRNGSSALPTAVNGSLSLQRAGQAFFSRNNLPVVLHDFLLEGNADYVAFLEAGIPSNGLTAGGRDLKSLEEQTIFQGSAFVPYDSCHKMPCDRSNNLDEYVLGTMSSAAAYMLWEIVG